MTEVFRNTTTSIGHAKDNPITVSFRMYRHRRFTLCTRIYGVDNEVGKYLNDLAWARPEVQRSK